MIAPTKLTIVAIRNTGLQRPPELTTNSAVRGPPIIAGIVAIVLDIPNVIALKDGAMSKWFAKCPHELKANKAMQHEIIINAVCKLSAFININRKIEGPTRPIVVIHRLTDKTVQFELINESAKWPATMLNNEFITKGTAVKDKAVDLTPKCLDR